MTALQPGLRGLAVLTVGLAVGRYAVPAQDKSPVAPSPSPPQALVADGSSSAAPIATRVAHLRGTQSGGANGGTLLKFAVPNPTVFDDAIADIMTVGAGPDWFFASANDTTDRGPDDFLN